MKRSIHAAPHHLGPVVEKELLPHDILRAMSEAGLLTGLTFTGGHSFKCSDLAKLGGVLTERLQTRCGLPVKVSDPVKTGGKVSTWKLTIETRGDKKHLPAQRIHMDICAIPSHAPRPMMLCNLYGIGLGTHSTGAESRGNPCGQNDRAGLS